MNIVTDILGWAGAIMLLVAYAGVSFKKIPSTAYQFLNAGGSAFLVVNTVYHRALPPAFLNSVWATIAVVALIRRTAAPAAKAAL